MTNDERSARALRLPAFGLLWCLGILVSFLFTGCRSAHFYVQAVAGQWEVMHKARPLAEARRDAAVPEQVRARLALVEELRKFAARELGLPAEKQYDRYADLGRPYVVWVVFAAPEFSTEAKTWTYPVLGKLKYRGWFDEAHAKSEGEELKRQGYDVTVGGTEAYSTLGWLRDPVLNTFLSRSDADLAELIFHELTHQAVFLKGDTDFNEALATAVGGYGARLWLKSKGRARDLQIYDRRQRLKRQIIAAILKAKAELTQLYAQHAQDELPRRRALKTEAFTRLRDEAARLRAAAGVTLRKPPSLLNNASLNSVAAYYTLLPGFERMLAECGSVPAFLERIRSMKPLTRDARRRLLEPAR